MNDWEIRVGQRVVLSTPEGEGEEEAVIARVLHGPEPAGLWLVETAQHGRVVIVPRRCEWTGV